MTRLRKSNFDWRAKTARVAELLPQDSLHPAVLRWVEKKSGRDIWTVAFSGGADSLALLLLLWAHWPARREKLVALHFNHRLRGRESTADEKFCRSVCAALGVRLRVGLWRRARKGASEAEARTARHLFFATEMKRRRTRILWLAHQQDDIAESMLMRLARGSGTGGLASPRPVLVLGDGRTHLRPLLTLKKSELLAALRWAGVMWREDPSNVRGDFFRNRIRGRVLPAWIKAAERDALAGAALSRERLEEDEQALETWVDTLAPLDRAKRLNLRALAGRPRAVTRRALHRWLLALKQPTGLSRQGFEVLLALVERGRPTRFSLGARGFAFIQQGKLSFRKG
ncbi:MAG: tRNA lysidine(34) synthetase TilS [Lacunisphaera sp.]|nr:tRNA lysidine(34) synthetase TilS [Lacunisphaera sp.]